MSIRSIRCKSLLFYIGYLLQFLSSPPKIFIQECQSLVPLYWNPKATSLPSYIARTKKVSWRVTKKAIRVASQDLFYKIQKCIMIYSISRNCNPAPPTNDWFHSTFSEFKIIKLKEKHPLNWMWNKCGQFVRTMLSDCVHLFTFNFESSICIYLNLIVFISVPALFHCYL